jgi:hypothetical protein
VLVVARLVLLPGSGAEMHPLLPVAWLWQDIVFLALFAMAEMLSLPRAAMRVSYAALVLLIAVSTSVAVEMGSPLTMPLLRAARGTLSDSIWHEVTPLTLAVTGSLLALGVLAPRIWRTISPPGIAPARWLFVLLVVAVAASVAGPAAVSRVDTRGMHRNALFAVIGTSLPRVRAAHSPGEWRRPLNRAAAGDGAESGQTLGSLAGAFTGSNVLLIMLESTGAQYLRPYGAAEDPMPNLTNMAQDAIVFENAYAVYPESIKGMLSYLASRYPAFDLGAELHERIASPSLASVLAEQGYRTALFHSGRFMYLGMDVVLRGMKFGSLEDAGDIGGNRNSSFGVDEPAAVRRVLEWIDSVPRGEKFFAAYLPIAGHHPYVFDPPAPFPARTDLDLYRNSLFDGDRALGTLFDGLRDRGLDSSTVVVIAGDHGEAFLQHPNNIGHTLAIYEENVRVPLLVVLPAGRRISLREAVVASLVDVPPTVLSLLGVGSPGEFQGRSLLDGEQRAALFFTDYSQGLVGLRDGCMKYIHELGAGRSRAFDLCRDPGERSDVADPSRGPAKESRARLMRWIAAQVALVQGSAGG